MTSHRPLEQLGLEELRARTSLKWRRYPADVLPLWVAEMDTALAPPIAEALRDAVDRGDTGYPVPERYVAALADFARARWGWSFEPAQARLVPDVMLGVVEMLKLVTAPGDAVVVNPPVYPPFFAFVRGSGREIVEAPLGAGLRLDLPGVEAAFAAATAGGRAAAYLLCNPHNPTGTVHTADELAAVALLAAEHGVRVVVDEIHAPLVHDAGAFTPYLTAPGSERGLVLQSASKAWNLAGLKAAAAVSGPEAVDDLDRMEEVAGHGASHLGVIAHEAAYREGGGWLDDLLADVVEKQALLGELLASRLPGVVWQPGESTYLAWLDCRGLGLGDDPAAHFLERGRVALGSGPDFGAVGRGHVRLNYATRADVLAEAVERMASPTVT